MWRQEGGIKDLMRATGFNAGGGIRHAFYTERWFAGGGIWPFDGGGGWRER